MRNGFLDCFREAFNAKPIGMWIPPNRAALAAFGMLGILNPGMWLVGAGVEWAYRYTHVSSRRFRGWVDARGVDGSLIPAFRKKGGEALVRGKADENRRVEVQWFAIG